MRFGLIRVEPPQPAPVRGPELRLVVLTGLEQAFADAAGEHGLDLVGIAEVDDASQRADEARAVRLAPAPAPRRQAQSAVLTSAPICRLSIVLPDL